MAAVPEESAVERDVFPLECWSPCVGCLCGCSQALNELCLNQLVLHGAAWLRTAQVEGSNKPNIANYDILFPGLQEIQVK